MTPRDENGRERRVGEIPPQMIERIWTTVEESTDRSLGGLVVLLVDKEGQPGFFGVWNRQGEAIAMAGDPAVASQLLGVDTPGRQGETTT